MTHIHTPLDTVIHMLSCHRGSAVFKLNALAPCCVLKHAQMKYTPIEAKKFSSFRLRESYSPSPLLMVALGGTCRCVTGALRGFISPFEGMGSFLPINGLPSVGLRFFLSGSESEGRESRDRSSGSECRMVTEQLVNTNTNSPIVLRYVGRWKCETDNPLPVGLSFELRHVIN